MECPCKTKWKEEVKKKFNAVYVSSYNPYDMETLIYRKIVNPKGNYGKDTEPRISKVWFSAGSKDFKFCPHCGKKLNNGNDGIPPKPKVLGILPNFI